MVDTRWAAFAAIAVDAAVLVDDAVLFSIPAILVFQ